MLRLSLLYHIRKIWLRAVNSIGGVWYYGQSLLSQFNLTKLSSHESIYRTPIQPLLLSLKQLPLLCYLDPLSMLIWFHWWIIHIQILPLVVTRLFESWFQGFFFYLRWDLISSRTWRKKDNLVLQRPSHVFQGTKITEMWDGNIKLHSRLCYWRSCIAMFFYLFLPSWLKSSLHFLWKVD